jgi:hypothetical protein
VYYVDLGRSAAGRRRQVTKGGFETKAAAAHALKELLRRVDDIGLHDEYRLTVAQYLEEWLASKRGLRPSTRQAYRSHLDHYLVPHVGAVKLVDLRPLACG